MHPEAEPVAQSFLPARRSEYLRLLWPLALVSSILVASGTQLAPGPPVIGFDKVAHVLFFGLLATHLCRYPADPARRLSIRHGLFSIGMIVLFGASDELHQSLNPYRTYDLIDLAADAIGAVTATLAYQHWGAYRRLLEWDLLGKKGVERSIRPVRNAFTRRTSLKACLENR